MTNKFVLNHLTYCATMLDDNFGKETIYKIKLDFISIKILNLIDRTSQHGGVQ